MTTGTELIVAEPREVAPAEHVERASRVAAATRAIVEATAVTIQGRRYVKVEGWMAICLAHGCVASSGEVTRTDTGYRAIGTIRRADTGTTLAQAEGFVGDDERTWAGRPEFARRAMAQTRAISRACRSAFAHVIILMSAGLETTPAEEMEHLHQAPAPPRPRAQVVEVLPQSAATDAVAEGTVAVGTVVRVTSRDGETNGKKWTRYGVLLAEGGDAVERWHNTFSESIASDARAAAESGAVVTVAWRPGRGDSRDIVSLVVA